MLFDSPLLSPSITLPIKEFYFIFILDKNNELLDKVSLYDNNCCRVLVFKKIN